MIPNARSRRRVALGLSALVALALVLGAWRAGHPRVDRPSRAFALPPEIQHREHVIDSIASTINTDTLYRAYHSMLVAPHPETVAPLIDCLEARMMWPHGMYPAERAIKRMQDTLWRGVEEQVDAMETRIPASGYVQSNDALCAPFGRRGRLVVDGIPLDPSPANSGQLRR